MIPLLSFLSFAQAELSIQTNIQEHYIAGQPIFVDIRIQNTGESTETLPNLKEQTWQVVWTIENKNGKQKIHSTKQDSDAIWTLEPRQMKEVRFLVPSSAQFPKGRQTLQLQIQLSQTSYAETNEFTVHSKSILWDDREIRSEQAFFPEGEYLWGQAFSATEQMIFLEENRNMKRSIPLFKAPKELRFQQSISNHDHHIYGIQQNQLLLHTLERNETQKTQKVALPWKDVSILARGVTDSEQRLQLPLWIPDPQKSSGAVRSIQISQDGSISYRKIISLPEKPIVMDTALTNTGTPLYLIQTAERVYLFPLTQTGNAKIDQLPPQNITIRAISEEESVTSQFGIDSESGLIIHILNQTDEQIYSEFYSLQGKEQTKKMVPLPSKPLDIKEISYHKTQLLILGKDESSWYQFSEDSWKELSPSSYPADQIIKLDLFQDKSQPLSVYPVPKED